MRKKFKCLLALVMAMMLAFSMMPATAMAAENSPTVVTQYQRQYKSNALTIKSGWDPEFYIAQNPDVLAVYGPNRLDLYYQHMMKYGIKEGRVISPFLDLQAYRDANPDLVKVYGNNMKKIAEHFYRYGVYEAADGRRGSEGILFNPIAYANEHPEVAAQYKTLQELVKYTITSGVAAEEATVALEARAAVGTVKNGGGSSSNSSNSSSNVSQPGNTGGNSGGNPVNPPVIDPPVVEPDPVVSVDKVVTVTPETDGDKTTATTDADAVKTAIEEAKANDDAEAVNITLNLGNDVAQTAELTLSAATVTELKEAAKDNTAVTVTVNSGNGNVTLPLEAITKAQGGTNEAVVLEISDVDKTELTGMTDAQGAAVDLTNAVVVDVTLKVGGAEASVNNLANDINITVAAPADAKRTTVYFIDDTNKQLVRIGTYDVSGSTVSFGINHLTTFVVEEFACELADEHENLHLDVNCGGEGCDYVGTVAHTYENGSCACGATCTADTCPDKAGHGAVLTTETCQTCGTNGMKCPKADEHAVLHDGVECDGVGCDYVGTADHTFADGSCECGATLSPEDCPNAFVHTVTLITDYCPLCGAQGQKCTIEETHKFGETCDTCGYDGSCIRDHDEIYVVQRCGYCDEPGNKSTDECPDVANHTKLMIDQLCDICRFRGSVKYTAESCANKRMHHYGGVCEWCDFDYTICPEDHDQIYTTKTCPTCGVVGIKVCTVEHGAEPGYVCSECGTRTLCADGKHYWQPGLGTCRDCGLGCPNTHVPGETCSVCNYSMPALPNSDQQSDVPEQINEPEAINESVVIESVETDEGVGSDEDGDTEALDESDATDSETEVVAA